MRRVPTKIIRTTKQQGLPKDPNYETLNQIVDKTETIETNPNPKAAFQHTVVVPSKRVPTAKIIKAPATRPLVIPTKSKIIPVPPVEPVAVAKSITSPPEEEQIEPVVVPPKPVVKVKPMARPVITVRPSSEKTVVVTKPVARSEVTVGSSPEKTVVVAKPAAKPAVIVKPPTKPISKAQPIKEIISSPDTSVGPFRIQPRVIESKKRSEKKVTPAATPTRLTIELPKTPTLLQSKSPIRIIEEETQITPIIDIKRQKALEAIKNIDLRRLTPDRASGDVGGFKQYDQNDMRQIAISLGISGATTMKKSTLYDKIMGKLREEGYIGNE